MKTKYIITTAVCAFLLGCDKDKFELSQPENSTKIPEQAGLYYKENPQQDIITLSKDGTYTFVAKTPNAKDAGTATLDQGSFKTMLENFNTFKGVKDYQLLPEANYSFSGASYAKDATQAEVTLTIKGYATLDYGDYLLPLKVQMAGNDLYRMIVLHKDAEYSPLTETSKKPMPPGTYACPDRKEPMKMVAYVETNDWDIRNMGQFILKESKKPVFDIVVLFAANMNYDLKAGRRVLSFNDKLQPILNDPDKYIKPLRDRGIKVIVDILPNHQGVGYFNFQNYEEALDFARQCKEYTNRLGIDGWDIDEEYADYHKLSSKPSVGNQSVFWFMRAMKEVMSDKLLTLYDYAFNISADEKDETGKGAADYLDYSWANYGTPGPSSMGVPKSRYGQYSVEANYGTNYSDYYAQENLDNCYGLFMFFNINGAEIKNGGTARNLSAVTKLFYGEECEFVGKYHEGYRK
ncbi:protein of unknown function [Capnocytophaga haemolytica]|jgi:mannosyl-glycoprotein endo-beta-N-acetylglucosaminidase H|uniref:Endo-beta-N-acetylglucosaminidase H n=1 Tax=Capnocytophaga haemolytica TaxID=45243 RepID=A0AAX2GZG0_9FLAO|nr:DUF1735 domain-containing protein [Capnocytophaga haemolytica]AMD86130.1 hypothetical protein AXF12_11805 [Capnocytophaga haemolytica]SFO05840.1 protein of unknown function [Capnocytophaga haemolytica]SNV13754.1 Endo-beta-N-acetylglucosaminidase H precursor [Capnocytophaga haemolytica]